MGEITIRTDDLMTVQDAARLLKRPRLAVYRMIDRKDIAGIKLGGVMFVPTSELERMQKEKGGAKVESIEPVQKQ